MTLADLRRDFGYLMPFLDRMETAARTAPPAVRGELQALVKGEKERWRRIEALLSGEVAPPPAAPPSTVPTARRAEPSPGGFTIGSLRRG